MGYAVFKDENTCVKAYDPDTKSLIGTYKDYWEAGNKLGINHSAVKNACSRRGRSYSTIHQKNLALRLAKKETENKTSKN